MLELRPNCEWCDRDLPPSSADARICSYECTWCADCAEQVLEGVCPNCGGNLVPRPIRPSRAWRDGVSLRHQPAGSERRHTRWTRGEVAEFAGRLRGIAPADR
ncbi:MAG TPA: DUF1272 domain-containing protein [Woeseiaceae bacterium]|nr:DUF1272 domain-containing protein [Woeseiaceae bacterium]